MENIKPVIENIADDIKDYVETSITLYKHQATQKGAEVASEAIINLLIAFFIGTALLFGSIACSLYLSELLGHPYSGFLIMTGFYALLGFIVILTKDKWLKNRLVDSFIKSIYKDQYENKN